LMKKAIKRRHVRRKVPKSSRKGGRNWFCGRSEASHRKGDDLLGYSK
jgi:hypothetical protein